MDGIVIGELGLNGSMLPVRGIIGKLLAGRQLKYHTYITPKDNLLQAQLMPHVTLLPVESLKQFYDYLTTGASITPVETGEGLWRADEMGKDSPVELRDIIGQDHAKRALEIAAAGGHNVFLSGPPCHW